MSLQVLVSFPGNMSLDQFSERIQILKGMGCQVHLEGAPIHKSIEAKGKKPKGAFQIAEALTPNEEKLIDLAMERIHREGSSDLMDSMTASAIGRLKPNMSKEIIAYYQMNPGHTTAQCASDLADKFIAHYVDINQAFTRIRSLINTMSYAKGSQKRLEKRGGYVGRGGDAQVFAL